MITYAQNFEDVMLERLFQGTDCGFYVDIGAWDPTIHSVTQHFYDKGWHGINVEPIPSRHKAFVAARPRDINLRAAVGVAEGKMMFFECTSDSALSTADVETARSMRTRGLELDEYEVDTLSLNDLFARHAPPVVEFLKLDIEGLEGQVVKNFNLQRYRPRVLVIESTMPASQPVNFESFDGVDAWSSWERFVLSSGYVFGHFDGLNRFYVRQEDESLVPRLKLPPGIFDRYTPHSELQKLAERDADRQAKDEVIARLSAEIETITQRSDNLLGQVHTLTEMIKNLHSSTDRS
jgi:FkbM family methyltransferase